MYKQNNKRTKQYKQIYLSKNTLKEWEQAGASHSRALIAMFLGDFIELKEHGDPPEYPLEVSDRLHPIQMKDFA